MPTAASVSASNAKLEISTMLKRGRENAPLTTNVHRPDDRHEQLRVERAQPRLHRRRDGVYARAHARGNCQTEARYLAPGHIDGRLGRVATFAARTFPTTPTTTLEATAQ